MIVQIITLHSDFAWKYYSEKFGISDEFRKFDYFGLLIKNSEIQYIFTRTNVKIFFADSEIFIAGRFEELVNFAYELRNEEIKLANEIEKVLINFENYDDFEFPVKGRRFLLNEPHIMGILNVTPDSFSDGGKYTDINEAISYAMEMIEAGAEIIDVGGESTRPGAEKVSVEEEIDRVIPVISGIRARDKNILISIDTTKSEVAEKALQSGASILNDISAYGFDSELLNVVKKYDATYVLMHMKGTPQTMQKNPIYEEPIAEIYQFFSEKISELINNGIKNIIIDPGIGFGKRLFDNYEILNRLEEFKGLGFPILIGLSRKSFLGDSLGLKVNEREGATSVAETVAIRNGARFIRTHNVFNAKIVKEFLNYINKTEALL